MTRRPDPLAGFFTGQEAYKAAFQEVPTISGIPQERWPRLVEPMREAVLRGRPLTEAEVRAALGVPSVEDMQDPFFAELWRLKGSGLTPEALFHGQARAIIAEFLRASVADGQSPADAAARLAEIMAAGGFLDGTHGGPQAAAAAATRAAAGPVLPVEGAGT